MSATVTSYTATNKEECFLRVGDETRRLSATEERELIFDKGESFFDSTLVKELTREDLDLEAVQAYGEHLGVSDVWRILQGRDLYVQTSKHTGVTQAGWLLFGKETPVWCYIRYLRYAGTTIETGPRSNIKEDIRLEGTLPALIEQARNLIANKLGTLIRLTPSGRFGEVPTLPEFAWLEAIVNAVTHRSYSLQGDGIRIRHFDDRLEVESPGRLPGLVRVKTIRTIRFSRNPHIARVLHEMDFVRELGEGVNRMFEEMDLFGLRDPVYSITEGSVRVTLYTRPDPAKTVQDVKLDRFLVVRQWLDEEKLTRILATLKERKELSTREAAELIGVSVPTARNYMKQLEGLNLIVAKRKSKTDPTSLWAITDAPFWSSESIHLKTT